MFQVTLLVSLLLLVHHTDQNPLEVQTACNGDASLECWDFDADPMDFIAVTWYKVSRQKTSGIIRKQKDKSPQKYNFSREARFGDNLNLLLPQVTPEDSGTYKCDISAKVGGQNREAIVNLSVNECVTPPVLTTKTHKLNTTHTKPSYEINNLPVTWSVTCYVAVAVAKILLSIICIQVIHFISSRRQKNHWSN